MRKLARAALTAVLAAAVPLAPAFAQTAEPTQSPSPSASPGPSIDSVSFSPSSLYGGRSSTGTVTFSSDAQGTVVALESDSRAVDVPAEVTAEGASATFTASTLPVNRRTTATVTATAADSPPGSGTLIVLPIPTTPSPGPKPSPKPSPSPSPSPSPPGDKTRPDKPDGGNRKQDRNHRNSGGKAGVDKRKGGRSGDARKARTGGTGRAKDPVTFETARIDGAFSTAKLVERAARLRALGWPEKKILATVYAPFIIGGEASWVDTWHAPRYGPAPGQVRVHEGEDVFCNYGDPVLASESGIIEFDEQDLGGRIARLHRSDGSYFYYAHLSDWNTADFDSGDHVRMGDVIGYCGNTGNAITTPPHVHFGLYSEGGTVAHNPMRYLVAWLRSAETNTRVVITRVVGDRVASIDHLTAARRFGDAFAPDRSKVEGSDAVLASLEEPSHGVFGVVEGALALAAEGALEDEEVDAAAAGLVPDSGGEKLGADEPSGADEAVTGPAALP